MKKDRSDKWARRLFYFGLLIGFAISELGLVGLLTSWVQRLAGPILLFVVGVILWVVANEMAETEERRKLQEGRNY